MFDFKAQEAEFCFHILFCLVISRDENHRHHYTRRLYYNIRSVQKKWIWRILMNHSLDYDSNEKKKTLEKEEWKETWSILSLSSSFCYFFSYIQDATFSIKIFFSKFYFLNPIESNLNLALLLLSDSFTYSVCVWQ